MSGFLTNGELLFEVVYERMVENFGLAGGTLHVLVVKNACEPVWQDTLVEQSCVRCSKDPYAVDGRRMGPIERSRCWEVT